MTRLTIIMPFQNVEDYIEESLNSVINQTLQDIEIICVDDGSTDNSRKIVENYQEKDNRIKLIIIDEAKGQSHARNKAIKIATGEYVGFVDSDDFADSTMFEKMYYSAATTDSDITMCQTNLFDNITKETTTNDYYSLKKFEKYHNSSFNAEMTRSEILDYPAVIWNKIYKTEFLRKINAYFEEGFIYEDLPFCYETYIKAEKVNIVWEFLYNYRQNRTSSTMQNTDKKVYDRVPMVKKTYEALKDLSYFEEDKGIYISWIGEDIFHRFTLLEKKYYEQYFPEMKELFESFEIGEKEKEYLTQSYCHDEFFNIRENDFLGFWNFLIDKYKTANKRIKEAEHRCNLDIIAIKKYLQECQENFVKRTNDEIRAREDYYYKKLDEVSKELEQAKSLNYELKKDNEYLDSETKNQLISKDEIINSKEEIIKEKEAVIQEQSDLLLEKQKQIMNIEFEIRRKEDVITENEKILLEKNEKIEENNRLIQEINKTIEEKETEVQTKNIELEKTKVILEESQDKLERINQTLKEKVDYINKSEEIIEQQCIKIEEAYKLIEEKTQELEKNNEEIKNYESKIKFLEKEVDRKKEELWKQLENQRLKEKELELNYKETIQKQINLTEEQLEKQKDFYENNYKFVKIALDVSRKIENLQNTFKKIMKKN